jgi:hypothetical protein
MPSGVKPPRAEITILKPIAIALGASRSHEKPSGPTNGPGSDLDLILPMRNRRYTVRI